MLFNSYAFIFGFFPVVFLGFFLAARHSRVAAGAWLGLASLVFYGWWRIEALPLLVGSILANYAFAQNLADPDRAGRRKALLFVAIAVNLAVLGLFKYMNFFIGNFNAALSALDRPQLATLEIVLPIGISFFTFTQIAFLVDCWQGKVKERNFLHYVLFVTYFPHLIAGPVLHHSQMMPQFARPRTYRIDWDAVAAGTLVFTVGLAKKLFLADPLGLYADSVFRQADAGAAPGLFVSWAAVLAYTFQIYFDFSGYTDMALGLSLFFRIRLPINFDSPYKATSIIEFWRRWHITLSNFLRDYLYIPLGGNKRGPRRRYINLIATMLLGGLWHGANWTFVLWGGAHGIMLTVNHWWRKLRGQNISYGVLGRTLSWLLTFLSICFTWVLFRAENLGTAASIYRGMLGFNGVSLPQSVGNALGAVPGITFDGVLQGTHADPLFLFGLIVAAFFCALIPGNMNAHSSDPHAGGRVYSIAGGFIVGATLCLCVLSLARTSSPQFLYFQF